MDASPDLVISVGDLVDWYSDENKDFVLELLEQLKCPWLFTPGNHDLEYPVYPFAGWRLTREKSEAIKMKWEEAGFDLGNRYIDSGDTGIILINSAFSDVTKGTKEWLNELLPKRKRNLIFTHVPFDIPAVRNYILSMDPHRDMKKYVQSYAPDLFDETIQNQVDHVFSGHLHFTGRIHTPSTDHHLVGMGISPVREPLCYNKTEFGFNLSSQTLPFGWIFLTLFRKQMYTIVRLQMKERVIILYTKSLIDCNFCRGAEEAGLDVAKDLNGAIAGHEVPSPLKIGYAGCALGTSEPLLKDIGVK
jgi:hypothetical protein